MSCTVAEDFLSYGNQYYNFLHFIETEAFKDLTNFPQNIQTW